MSTEPTIIYTLTDEAPLLATCALLPVIRAFTKPAGVRVDESDISVAARILAQFPDVLTPEQRVPDTLSELGKKTLEADANIIKLPNISASVPQLVAAIRELQRGAQGLFYCAILFGAHRLRRPLARLSLWRQPSTPAVFDDPSTHQ